MRNAVSGSGAERKEDLNTEAVTEEVTHTYGRAGGWGVSTQQHPCTLVQMRLMGALPGLLYARE